MRGFKILWLVMMCMAFALQAAARDYDSEHLTFRVTYKWGLIQKEAGAAEFTLKRKADHYEGMLTARTHPWADRIFMIRDTLRGNMRLEDMSPILYDKSTHEANQYRHDVIKYTYHGNRVIANSHRLKIDKKGRKENSDTVMSALLPAVDMLSVYYFVRSLPFETMKPGAKSKANIFSGKKIEKLTLTYDGDELLELNGKKYDCYVIHFMFSSERIKDSSKPMKAWIEKTGSRIPVKLQGELPVGKIQILYNDPNSPDFK